MTSDSNDPKTTQESEEEQRENRRARTYLGGKIVINEKGSVIDCLIKNKSDDGCQIIVETPTDIPDAFELKIGTTGERYQCTIAWCRSNKLGLKFEK